MKALVCAALVAAMPPLAALAALTAEEGKIVAAVKERSLPAIDLLERAVRINSGTLNVEGVRDVGRLFDAELSALGFSTRWAQMPAAMQRAGHLVATRTGTRGKRVLLLGHIDTVFDKVSSVPIWDRRGGIVRGQGVNDMKGGDVIIVEALRALHRLDLLDGATVTVVLTGDEERVGSPVEKARAAVVEAARASDVALSFEALIHESGSDRAVVGRRGAGGWTLEVTGKPNHSRGVFSESFGYGAIYETARILNEFREKVREPGLTFNPGIAVGGSQATYDPQTASGTAQGKTNIIAAQMEATGDIRYLDPGQRDRAFGAMRDIASRSLPQTQAALKLREVYPPMPANERNRALLALYSQASVDAGLEPIEAASPEDKGAGDIQFAAPFNDCLDGLGTTGRGSHTDGEQMTLASIERATIRAALLIYRLTR